MYPGVYDALRRLGIIPFCQFSYKNNEDLFMQFYATVFFMNDDARTMRWMSGTAVYSAPFAKFAEIIPYQFFGEHHPDFERVSEIGRDKDEIAFAYKQEKSFVTGSIKDLLPTYDTLRLILRYTLTPKVGDSRNLRSSMLDIFLMVRDRKKVDVLDTMFLEIHECIRLRKSLIYAPFIQALIESVCPARHIPQHVYPVSVLKRDLNWRPPAPAPYVAPKLGRNPRPEDRATYTPGASSSARIPRQRGPPVGPDAPAAFTVREKKTLFKTISNLFKMCQSIQKKQLKDSNRVKAEQRAYKAHKAQQSGTPAQPGPEDQDSQLIEYSFPMSNWLFDDKDDASSKPPIF